MDYFPNLDGRVVALDTESTGLSFIHDKLFALSIAFRGENNKLESYYFDLRRGQALQWAQLAFKNVKTVFGHYFKHDMAFCREAKILIPRARVDCTMIREFLIDENKYTYSLDDLGMKYFERKKLDIWPELAAMFGGKPDKETQAPNLWRAPFELVEKYALIDASLCFEIYEVQEPILVREDLGRIHKVERELLPVVVDMERGGVPTDPKRARIASNDMTKIIHTKQKELNVIAGYEVNANSPPQTKKLLGVHQRDDGHWYTADNLKLEKTATGAASLDQVRLQQCTLPAAQLIADLRGFIKARDTFLNTYILEKSHNGIIHASINQTRTEDGNGIYTGRLSISDPALQQIHKRNKALAAIVRACFIPDDDCDWVCFDWSQKDFRVFAHFLNDVRINEAYATDANMDFHALVSGITGLPRDRDQKTGGANAKQVNLACVFGMGPGELAKQCNLPYTVSKAGYLVAGAQAKEMFAKYHNAIPGVRKLQNSVESVAKKRGYIRTMLGRRVRFPNGRGAHKAAGLLYQTTAADAMKVKLVELHKLIEDTSDWPSRLMVCVHDEFDVSVDKSAQGSEWYDEMRHLLERFDGNLTPMKYRIPIRADFGSGPNWWEASK